MTASELIKVIGKPATVRIESLSIACVITDCKQVYGSVRYQVQPVAGSGSQWIDASRVSITDEINRKFR